MIFPSGLAGAGSPLGGDSADVTSLGPGSTTRGDYPNVLGDNLGYVSRRVPIWRGANGKEDKYYGKHEVVFLVNGANLDNFASGEALVPLAWVNIMLTRAYNEGLNAFDSFAHAFVRDHAWYFPELEDLLGAENFGNLRAGVERQPWELFSDEEDEEEEGSESETENDRNNRNNRRSEDVREREDARFRGLSRIRRATVRFLKENMPPAEYFFNNGNRSFVGPSWMSTAFEAPRPSPSDFDEAIAVAEALSRSAGGKGENPHKNDPAFALLQQKAYQEIQRRSRGALSGNARAGNTPFDGKALTKAFSSDAGTRDDYARLRRARNEALVEMVERAKTFFRAPAEQMEQKMLTNMNLIAAHGLFSQFYHRYFTLLGVCDVSNQAVPAQSQMYGYYPSEAPGLLSSSVDKIVFQREIQVRNYWGDELFPNTRVGFLLRRKLAGGTGEVADRFLASASSFRAASRKGGRYSDRFGRGLADPFGGTDSAVRTVSGTNRKPEEAAFEDYGGFELVPVRAGRSGRISVENMAYVNAFGVKEYPRYLPFGTVKVGSTSRSSHGNRLQACGLAQKGVWNKFATQRAVASLEAITVLVALNA